MKHGLIATPSNWAQLDEFVEIMLEVALTRTPTMKIGRDAEYPTAFIQQRFDQLTSDHIEKVMDGIRENTTRVRNARAYLLAALFNAPSTMDNHYTMQLSSAASITSLVLEVGGAFGMAEEKNTARPSIPVCC